MSFERAKRRRKAQHPSYAFNAIDAQADQFFQAFKAGWLTDLPHRLRVEAARDEQLDAKLWAKFVDWMFES